MKYRNRITAAVLILAVMCSFTACAEKEPDFEQEEELPYGATMRSNKTGFAVPMTYDRRFLEEEQVAEAANILAAVQNSDAALYESSTLDFYAAYQLEEVYSYETMDALVKALHDSVASQTGEDFRFSMVLINSISTDRASGELGESLVLLDGIWEGEGSFSDTVVNAWELTMEWDILSQSDEKTTVVDEQHMCLFQTENGYFCII